MDIKQFIKDNQINVNETQQWIDLIQKFIEQYGVQSLLFENKKGQGIYIDSQEEHQLLEDIFYEVENTYTTLNYIFTGNLQYGEDYNG